jgi:hypothetical protein
MLEFGAGDALDEAFTRTPAARTVTPETYMRLTEYRDVLFGSDIAFSEKLGESPTEMSAMG